MASIEVHLIDEVAWNCRTELTKRVVWFSIPEVQAKRKKPQRAQWCRMVMTNISTDGMREWDEKKTLNSDRKVSKKIRDQSYVNLVGEP